MFKFLSTSVLTAIQGALVAVLLILIALLSVRFFGPDAPLEEASEELFYKQTGKHVDFSPENPEESKKP